MRRRGRVAKARRGRRILRPSFFYYTSRPKGPRRQAISGLRGNLPANPIRSSGVSMPRKKVTIVGAGMTGGAMAQRLVERDICDVILQDDPQFAGTMHHGKALDESQAAPWEGYSSRISATDGWDETAG